MNFIMVKKIIDNWDPVELLATHSPSDEYDSETQEIIDAIINNTVGEVAQIIQDVFINAFGNDFFTRSLDECMAIAKEIIQSIN